MSHHAGCEWVVEAFDCEPDRLRDPAAIQELFDAMVREIGLTAVAPALLHQFPGPAGVTGLVLLAESHIACHTFPEFGTLCLNLFCCKPRPDWSFEERLRAQFGAHRVVVRSLERPFE